MLRVCRHLEAQFQKAVYYFFALLPGSEKLDTRQQRFGNSGMGGNVNGRRRHYALWGEAQSSRSKPWPMHRSLKNAAFQG
jgi:hypothetical protein